MNIKNIFVPAVLLTGIVLIAKKAVSTIVSGKNLNIKLTSIDFKSKSIIMTITNPYNGDVVINNITGDVIFNNNAIATINNSNDTTIAANKTTNLKLNIKINNFDAFGVLIDVLKMPKDKIKDYFTKGNLLVKGTINTAGLLVDFENKIM